MKRCFFIPLLLTIILLLPLFGSASAEEAEEPFIPTVLPEARYQELRERFSGSESSAVRLLSRTLSSNYRKATIADLLASDDRESRFLGVHLLKLSAPDEWARWAAALNPEFVMTPDEILPATDSAIPSELLNSSFYIAGAFSSNARASLLRGLYGDGAFAGIGYTQEEALADAAWIPGELPDMPEYTVRPDGTAVYLHCDPETAACVILPEFEGHPVTAVADAAFRDCGLLESVSIPDSVTEIGDVAFWCCGRLASVTLPDGLTAIGEGAFFGCTALREINLPEGLEKIGEAAFVCCTSLEEITIPASLRTVDTFVFSRDVSKMSRFAARWSDAFVISREMQTSGLTRVILCDGIEAIAPGAFKGCFSLTTIIIPDSVTRVADDAFAGCSSLTDIRISEDQPVLKIMDGALVTKAENRLLLDLSAFSAETYQVPQGIGEIAADAFNEYLTLRSFNFESPELKCVIIPEGVTAIGPRAFEGQNNLTSVTLPASLTDIGEGAFRGCYDLVFTVPAGSRAEQYCLENGCPYVLADTPANP